MRLMLLVSSMGSGGAERVAALLCNQWADDGHDVTLMPTFSGRGDVAYQLSPAVELAFLVDEAGARLARNPVGRLLALRRAICRRRPDVVVSFLTNVNVAAILATKGLDVPVIVSERTYPPLWPLPWWWEVARRLTYPGAHLVAMQTRQGQEWLARSIPRARSTVIPNPVHFPIPVNEPRVEPTSLIPSERRLLLAVGRLDRFKNFALLVDAFARLAPDLDDVDLVILGDGPERGAIEAQIDARNLEGRVLMPGQVGNLGDWYARADAFAQTSRVEGFPNVLLEALASELPAVALDCPTGPSDLISPGVNGYLLPLSADATAVAEALRDVLARSWKMVPAEAMRIRRRFELAQVARDWVTLARSLDARQVGRLPKHGKAQ